MLASRVAFSLFLIFAHLATATIHLVWNDLLKYTMMMVHLCLSTPSISVLQALGQLHLLVLFAFAVAASFRFTSAVEDQQLLTVTDTENLLTVSHAICIGKLSR
jgi:hypothetical protein